MKPMKQPYIFILKHQLGAHDDISATFYLGISADGEIEVRNGKNLRLSDDWYLGNATCAFQLQIVDILKQEEPDTDLLAAVELAHAGWNVTRWGK